MLRTIFIFPVLLLLALASQGQSVPPAPINGRGPFVWLDSLPTLWSVRNAESTLPFKTTSGADSRRERTLTLDPPSLAIGLDTLSHEHPMPYNEAIGRYIKYLVEEKASETEILLGYSRTFQPFIDTLVSIYGLPSYFRYMPAGSSNYYYRSITNTGASGPWLLSYMTARRYGLRVDSYVDERRNLTLSAQAAFRMVSDMHDIYGDWLLALGAYYCGPATVNKAIRRSGEKRSYWEIYSYLPEPERAFVPALIAVSFVMQNYEDLGLVPYEMVWPGTPDTVLVDNQVSLVQASQALDLPLDLLRELNPEYKRDVIPGLNGSLPLRLPEGNVDHYLAMHDSIKSTSDTTLQIQDTEPAPIIVQTPPAPKPNPNPRGVPVYYTVKSGDNLGLIAEWFDVRVSDVRSWNKIRGDLIRAGQRLVIYVPENYESYYLKINKMSFSQKQALKGPTASQSSSQTSSTKPSGTTKYTTYTVKPGDNPTTIAKKFPGVSAEDILKANNISDPRRLYVGQKLKIPLKS